ncbi:hypothetical protein HispidOSU_000366 [Sigmodon hispidus]
MNWNAKPENAAPKPPPYSKTQSSILQQFLMPSTTSQSSFNFIAQNQEACMYPSNSNSVSQPLLNVRSYITPQISVSNMHNRTVVASQTSVERVTYTHVKGAQQPNHNLQTVSSGVMQNAWMNSSMRNFMPSHPETTISHKPDGGTNMLYMHAPQTQLVTSDTYSVQLQVTPSNSVRVPITYQGNYQGNQGLNHSISDQLVDWAQCTSNEPTYPDYRSPPKQYPYLPQNFMQDPSVQKQNFVSSTTSLQVKNNQLPLSTQTLQSKHPVPVSSYQYAAETSKRLPARPYSCRYGIQHVQNSQSVSRHLPMEVPQNLEMHSSEKKDAYKGFQQQWQNTNKDISTIGKFCDLKINTKQSYNDSVSSSGDGVQSFVKNNQEERKYACNPNANQVLDTCVTKEKLVRDIKSLVEIKKKFSELARKIKINKDLLMAAGCSKTASTSYTEETQHAEFSAKEMSAKSDSHCSMELLATCLSLWKDQPPKTTEENVLKPLEEKQSNTLRTNTIVDGSSNPTNEIHVKNFCSSIRNSQKMTSSSQSVMSVLTPSFESSDTAVSKGTELQIAVVSPLILRNINILPGKELAPEVLPKTETVYPVVKEGSVCSLQNQQLDNTPVTTALPFDVLGAVSSTPVSAELSLPVHQEKQHKPTQDDLVITDPSPGKHFALGAEALPNTRDSTIVSQPMLQIESICSLAEGDISYNSQIAEIFNSIQNESLKPLTHQQVTNSQQEKHIDDTTENKDFVFQKDKHMQCTDVAHDVTEQPVLLQQSSSEYVDSNREIVEENGMENTGGNETTKDVCSPAAVQQDLHPQETDTVNNKSGHSLPAVKEINDQNEPVSYLHDQLSELLKEFPYGIETFTRLEVSVDQQKIHEISENQNDNKAGNVSEDSTDQIKITVLNSEQIKELFPEENQPCDLDKLAEPEDRKVIAEVKSLCDSQVPREESHDPGMLDLEKDKIHCCALGWLSVVYEGVPQCHCSSTEEKEKEQCSLEINSCKQGEQASSSGITIFEINPVSNNPKSPLVQVADKFRLPKINGEKTKTSKTKDNSSPKVEQELTGNFSTKCYKKDKDKSKTKQDSTLKMEHKIKNILSECDRPNSLKSSKTSSGIFHEKTSNSDKNMPAFSKRASLESLQKKHISQDSGSVKAHVGLLPYKDPCIRNNFLVQSVSPEKKKLKFKAGGSRLKYFEKRKADHMLTPDVEVKKKKYEKQEQNKNAGGTLKLCNTLTELDERANVKEKTVPNSDSSDSKIISCKSNRAITVQEYLQRQKDKHVIDASKNICIENVPHDSEHMKSSKHSALASWGKLVEGPGVSAETSKEPEHNSSHGKNLKVHHSEESNRIYSLSKNSKEKFDGKQPDKVYIDKAKLERLTSLSNKSSQIALQLKEQRKQYLNRVAFKCTERESICLSKLDSASKKFSKEKEKGRECTPMTKDDADKPSMLEFKLCPDVLLKNTSSVDKQDDLGPGEEQSPVQGSV